MASGEIAPDILDLLGFSPRGESPVEKPPVGEIPVVMTRADLCRFLGIPESRARHLVHAGKRGQYDVTASVRAVVADLSERAARQPVTPEMTDAKKRVAVASAEKLEIQNAKARGALLDAGDVAREWVEIVTDLRAALLAVPSRVAGRCGLDRRATAALDAELRAAMEMIADDR